MTEAQTAELVSTLLGVRTAVIKSLSGGRSDSQTTSTSRPESYQTLQRPLLFPDEIMRLPADEQVVFIRGLPPLKIRKLRYYDHPICKGLYHTDKKVG